ncbi:hypothetical protein EGO53_05595 [Serratia liquefaciens]|uniref:Uncharacterized protein n=1 Tax=Serratia liquefaciens TaxID=614 RepID=A0A515CSY5_SERLI|nr:hypothetical protein EGO53_05595 [Serratia liquefaciens]
MNPDKIDYERLGDDYIADNGGIEDAFRKIDMPIYVIYRHGAYKRYLSRSAAINNLARVMATKVFQIMNFRIRERDRYDAERQVWITGDLLPNYVKCCERAKRRILRLLAKQREKEKWDKEYRQWVEKRDELYSRKPY